MEEAIFAILGVIVTFAGGFLLGWVISARRLPVVRYAGIVVAFGGTVCACKILPDVECDLSLIPPKFHYASKNGLGPAECVVAVTTVLALCFVWYSRDPLAQGSSSGQVSRFEREVITLRLLEQARTLSRRQRGFLTKLLATGGVVGVIPTVARSLRKNWKDIFAWLLAWFMEPSREDRMYVFAWLRVRLRELTPEMKAEIGRLTVLIEDLGKMSSQLPEPPPTTGVNDG